MGARGMDLSDSEQGYFIHDTEISGSVCRD